MIPPRLLAPVKTVFWLTHSANEGRCRMCDRVVEADMQGWQFQPNGQPWHPNGGEAVPWDTVANAWLRAEGHHDTCPLKELAALILALEAMYQEELEPAEPAPPALALTPRLMARVAMHFRGWANENGGKVAIDDGDRYDNGDELIAAYEQALGGTPDDTLAHTGNLYNREHRAGYEGRPLPSDTES